MEVKGQKVRRLRLVRLLLLLLQAVGVESDWLSRRVMGADTKARLKYELMIVIYIYISFSHGNQ